MESPSTHTGRVLISWQGLLLSVLLLTFWSLPTTAQLAIVSTNVAEGKDVLLRIRNKPHQLIGYMWYRGEGTNPKRNIASILVISGIYATGPAYSGREKVNKDGSLLIKKAMQKDTGIYTVVAYLHDSKKEIGFGQLRVYQPVRVPTLLASNTTVTENKDAVVLTCNANAVSTQWFFNGMNLRLTERMKLSPDNSTLTIDPVRREDAGGYHCEVSNPISSAESWALQLHVNNE